MCLQKSEWKNKQNENEIKQKKIMNERTHNEDINQLKSLINTMNEKITHMEVSMQSSETNISTEIDIKTNEIKRTIDPIEDIIKELNNKINRVERKTNKI